MRNILILFCALLTGCSNSVTLPAFTDGYPGTPVAIKQSVSMQIPSHWHKWDFKDWGPLKRTGQLNLALGPLQRGANGPLIRVHFGRLDPTSPPTPQGQFLGYLDTMHIKEDSTVVAENYESLSHPVYGDISVWYLHSQNSGHCLCSQFVNKDAGLSVELICNSKDELKKHEDAFALMTKSFKIRDRSSRLGNDPRVPPSPR